ncbi:MAG: hypothetical protein Q9223_004666 [Gallowayella weberi]
MPRDVESSFGSSNYMIRHVIEAFDDSPSPPSSPASSTTTQDEAYAALRAIKAVYQRRGYGSNNQSSIGSASSESDGGHSGDGGDNGDGPEIASPNHISSPSSSMTPPSPSPSPSPRPPAPSLPTQRLLLNLAKQRDQKQLSNRDRARVLRQVAEHDPSPEDLTLKRKRSESPVAPIPKSIEEETANSPHPVAPADKSCSGASRLLSQRSERQLIRHATKDGRKRRMVWTEVAKEIGIEASDSAIDHAFNKNGHGRYPSNDKEHRCRIRKTVAERKGQQ